jgi:hypothetical protein
MKSSIRLLLLAPVVRSAWCYCGSVCPQRDKVNPPGYQPIFDADVPSVELTAASGRARIIAGELRR